MDYEAKRSVHEVNGACARNGFGKFHFRGVHEGHRRLWIFLILGVVLELLGLGLGGLYLHVRSLTSSLTNTEILPTYVSVASVFLTSVVGIGVGLLCAGTAILMGTHILQPMIHFTSCSISDDVCICYSPFNRQQLALRYSSTSLTSFTYSGVKTCAAIQIELVHVVIILCALYSLLSVVCIVSAILSLLAYRTERLYKAEEKDESYNDVVTVANVVARRVEDATFNVRQPKVEKVHNSNNQFSTSATEVKQPEVKHPEVSYSTEYVYSPLDVPLDYNEACRMKRRSQSLGHQHDEPSIDGQEIRSAPCASSTLSRSTCRRQPVGEVDWSASENDHTRSMDNRCRTQRTMTLANLNQEQVIVAMGLQNRDAVQSKSNRQFMANTEKLQEQARRAFSPTPAEERSENPDVRARDSSHPMTSPSTLHDGCVVGPTSTSTTDYRENAQNAFYVEYENMMAGVDHADSNKNSYAKVNNSSIQIPTTITINRRGSNNSGVPSNRRLQASSEIHQYKPVHGYCQDDKILYDILDGRRHESRVMKRGCQSSNNADSTENIDRHQTLSDQSKPETKCLFSRYENVESLSVLSNSSSFNQDDPVCRNTEHCSTNNMDDHCMNTSDFDENQTLRHDLQYTPVRLRRHENTIPSGMEEEHVPPVRPKSYLIAVEGEASLDSSCKKHTQINSDCTEQINDSHEQFLNSVSHSRCSNIRQNDRRENQRTVCLQCKGSWPTRECEECVQSEITRRSVGLTYCGSNRGFSADSIPSAQPSMSSYRPIENRPTGLFSNVGACHDHYPSCCKRIIVPPENQDCRNCVKHRLTEAPCTSTVYKHLVQAPCTALRCSVPRSGEDCCCSKNSCSHRYSNRNKVVQSLLAPCDTDLDDLDCKPISGSVCLICRESTTYRTPPYFPPPSYRRPSPSRTDSIHSLSNKSSIVSSDDVAYRVHHQRKGDSNVSDDNLHHNRNQCYLPGAVLHCVKNRQNNGIPLVTSGILRTQDSRKTPTNKTKHELCSKQGCNHVADVCSYDCAKTDNSSMENMNSLRMQRFFPSTMYNNADSQIANCSNQGNAVNFNRAAFFSPIASSFLSKSNHDISMSACVETYGHAHTGSVCSPMCGSSVDGRTRRSLCPESEFPVQSSNVSESHKDHHTKKQNYR